MFNVSQRSGKWWLFHGHLMVLPTKAVMWDPFFKFICFHIAHGVYCTYRWSLNMDLHLQPPSRPSCNKWHNLMCPQWIHPFFHGPSSSIILTVKSHFFPKFQETQRPFPGPFFLNIRLPEWRHIKSNFQNCVWTVPCSPLGPSNLSSFLPCS